MRIVIIIVFMLTAACAKGTGDATAAATCTAFESPYMVEYIDGSLVKSEVSQCGQEFKATALDQSGKTMSAEFLTIQLKDAITGVPYLTNFADQ